MCRIHEGEVLTHLGVELRKGLHADRSDDGAVTLCYHGSGNLRQSDWEVTLSQADIARFPVAPVTVTAPVSIPVFVPVDVTVPKRKHVAKTKPPVKSVVSKLTKKKRKK